MKLAVHDLCPEDEATGVMAHGCGGNGITHFYCDFNGTARASPHEHLSSVWRVLHRPSIPLGHRRAQEFTMRRIRR